MTPQQLAEACAAAMWEDDRASPAMGMAIAAVSPGAATLTMQVRPDMTNGHGTCHGGCIFALADSAFAFACNTRNDRAVAAHCDVFFLAPARLGQCLTATATERAASGRTGLYDVTVRADDGTLVAEFRGQSRAIGSRFFPGIAA